MRFALIICVCVATLTLASAQEPSKAELELQKRAKALQDQQKRADEAAWYKRQLAQALQEGAQKLDWAVVPVATDKDFKARCDAFLAKYKDKKIIFSGIVGHVFSRGAQVMNFTVHHPFGPAAKFQVFLRDIDQQWMVPEPNKGGRLNIVGVVKEYPAAGYAARVDAEFVGEVR